MTISNCVQDFTDLFVMLHPETEVDMILRPYFKHPDAIVQAATRLSWVQFAPYFALRDPSIIESSSDAQLYLKLLWSAMNTPQLMAIHLKIMIDAAEILGTLRLLCVVRSSREILLSSDVFSKSVYKLMSCDKCDALVGLLNLLLCLVSPLVDDFKSKLASAGKRHSKKTSATSKESFSEKWSHEYDWKSKELFSTPELSAKLRPLLSSAYQQVKSLAFALDWILKTDMNEIGKYM